MPKWEVLKREKASVRSRVEVLCRRFSFGTEALGDLIRFNSKNAVSKFLVDGGTSRLDLKIELCRGEMSKRYFGTEAPEPKESTDADPAEVLCRRNVCPAESVQHQSEAFLSKRSHQGRARPAPPPNTTR